MATTSTRTVVAITTVATATSFITTFATAAPLAIAVLVLGTTAITVYSREWNWLRQPRLPTIF